MVGCDTSKVSERIVYEDRTPASQITVTLVCERYKGTTTTDSSGDFSIIAPIDAICKLCAIHPEWGDCCYQGEVIVPMGDGEFILVP